MLKLANINKVYSYKKDKIHAVKDINLSISPGTILGLLGPNGAGKTSLIKIICGLIKPSSGYVYYNDVILENKSLGAVLEGSRNIYWKMTPKENLIYFALLRGVSKTIIDERSENLLNLFSLKEKSQHPVEKLSRGMQQKVSIAVAMIHDPDILLLDEPTLGLDIKTSKEMISILKKISSFNKTIIITSHNLKFIQETCNKIGLIKDGNLIYKNNISELLDKYAKPDINISIKTSLLITELHEKFDSNSLHVNIKQTSNNQFIINTSYTKAMNHKVLKFLTSIDVIIEKVITKDRDLEEVFFNIF